MEQAAKKGTLVTPDYFLSVTAINPEHAEAKDVPPNTSFGDTTVLVKSVLASDVHDIYAVYDHEQKSTIPPYESFRVTALLNSQPNQPVFKLEGHSKLFDR
jgi:hypothetical protein